MSVETFKADGVDFMIEDRAFRQRLYWDGQLASEISTVRPRISIIHRFATSEPASQIEVRTFHPRGWLVVRDGKFVGGQAPNQLQAIMWTVVAALGLASFAAGNRPGLLALFGAVLAASHISIRLSYESKKRSFAAG